MLKHLKTRKMNELTAQDLTAAKTIANEMCFDLNKRNIGWELSVKCNIASVDVIIEDYKNLEDQYKFQFWTAVKAELLTNIR